MHAAYSSRSHSQPLMIEVILFLKGLRGKCLILNDVPFDFNNHDVMKKTILEVVRCVCRPIQLFQLLCLGHTLNNNIPIKIYNKSPVFVIQPFHTQLKFYKHD